MKDQREKAKRTRISVTFTKPYIDVLNRLVEEEIYLNRGDIVLEALRILLGRYGIEPFVKSIEKTDKSSD